MIVFLDESGDLGFDFEAKQPSRFFTITLLVCDDRRALDGFRKAVRRTLKNKLNRRKSRRRVQELHGSDTALAIKRYFARQMPDRGWQLYSVTLNKQRVQPHLTTRSGKKKDGPCCAESPELLANRWKATPEAHNRIYPSNRILEENSPKVNRGALNPEAPVTAPAIAAKAAPTFHVSRAEKTRSSFYTAPRKGPGFLNHRLMC